MYNRKSTSSVTEFTRLNQLDGAKLLERRRSKTEGKFLISRPVPIKNLTMLRTKKAVAEKISGTPK